MANRLFDAIICGIAQAFGQEAPEAYGRLMRLHTTRWVAGKWRFAKGAYNITATAENVKRFASDTFDVPLDLPTSLEGRKLTDAELNVIFESIAKILIGRGDVAMQQ